jgi:hypothetical protein
MARGSYLGFVSAWFELPALHDHARLARMSTGSAHAELSTLHSQIEELTERIIAVADRYRDTPDSAITAELDGAERNLLTARRAVERAQHNLP